MPLPWRLVTTLTIPIGTKLSEEIDLRGNGMKNLVIVCITGPTGLVETVNPQNGSAPTVDGGTWGISRSNGVAVALGAGYSDTIGPILAGAFRIRSMTDVAAERIFTCYFEPYDRNAL